MRSYQQQYVGSQTNHKNHLRCFASWALPLEAASSASVTTLRRPTLAATLMVVFARVFVGVGFVLVETGSFRVPFFFLAGVGDARGEKGACLREIATSFAGGEDGVDDSSRSERRLPLLWLLSSFPVKLLTSSNGTWYLYKTFAVY